jgi:thermitase
MAFEYKVMGKTVRLEVDPNVVAVKFQPSAPSNMRAAAARDVGLSAFSERIELPNEGITLIPATGVGPATVNSATQLRRLSANDQVVTATPVFRMGENKVVPSNRIIVALDDATPVGSILAQYSLEIINRRENEFLLRVPDSADPLQISQEIAARPGVIFSEPDFITVGHHLPRFAGPNAEPAPAVAPNAAFPAQYAMTITQAADAWQLVQGVRNIAIAILDEGVDTTHRDLAPVVVGQFDGVNNSSPQTPNQWDGHGTSCAGLAAGAGVLGSGMHGSGSGCALIAVRIAYSQQSGGPWITSNDIIARSIDWAWQNGAAVLSNSWGGGAPSNSIVAAFERARTRGRQGLGCVIAIAVGNAAGPVNFPATIPNVLAVSASNEFDEFKTRTSRDGETWWGSCFGPEVSVAAPGVHNVTTDIVGAGGYDPSDYFAKFNGTSSATPIVAGACALILSAQPNLRENQVRTIIMNSADKVGATPYVNGHNDFFGFGRLNVLRSIQMAQATN